MRHELRLIGGYAPNGASTLQPYCICGWIASREYAEQFTLVMAWYRAHLDEVEADYVGGGGRR